MTTIADLLPADTAALLREKAKIDNTRLFAMAAGLPGSPFTRDDAGRLRLLNGRFATSK